MRNYIDPEKLSNDEIKELFNDIVTSYNDYLDSIRQLQFFTEEYTNYMKTVEDEPSDRTRYINYIFTDCNCLLSDTEEVYKHYNPEDDIKELDNLSEEEEDEDN